jgi:hypothetical protein
METSSWRARENEGNIVLFLCEMLFEWPVALAIVGSRPSCRLLCDERLPVACQIIWVLCDVVSLFKFMSNKLNLFLIFFK